MSMIVILFVVTTVCSIQLNAERIFGEPVRESYDYVIGRLKHTVSHVLFWGLMDVLSVSISAVFSCCF